MNLQKFGFQQTSWDMRSSDFRHFFVITNKHLQVILYVTSNIQHDYSQIEIQFQTKNNPIELNKSVHYQHVIRQNAVHEMRVGEDQRSTTEMEAYFDEQKSMAGRYQWKKGAFILLVVLAAACEVKKGV